MPKDAYEVDLLSSLERDLVGHRKMGIEEFAEISQRNLYPNQLLLLKLIFLEDLSQDEEDTLDYWISGGKGGGEVLISPMIRERIAWLKQHGA